MSIAGMARLPATYVWLGLMLATCLTWWSAQGGVASSVGTAVIVIVIAAIKARLVIRYFMDLRSAPLVWQLVFDAWVLVSAGAILAGYFLA